MPYVKESHRKKLDPLIEIVSDELAAAAIVLENPQQIGEVYFSAFFELSRLVKELATSGRLTSSSKGPQILAKAIFEVGTGDGSFWAGDLNYALTRIIQIVPRKLVEKRKWEKEFRYWTYAVTAGALERTALAVSAQPSPKKEEGSWLGVVLVGVLLDIKDEYKRRVNVPYEIEQQRINGDCYDVKL
jgi:hypothetical protein